MSEIIELSNEELCAAIRYHAMWLSNFGLVGFWDVTTSPRQAIEAAERIAAHARAIAASAPMKEPQEYSCE